VPRKLTPVPPPPPADGEPKPAATAAPRPRKKPAKGSAVAPVSIAPKLAPKAKAEAGAKPAASGVRASRAVVRPLTSIAPAALAPMATPSTARLHPVGALPPARIPPEALAPQRRVLFWGMTTGMACAAGISVVLHAIVLSIHFAPPDLKRLFDRGPPLEIALVNAKSKEKPQKAEILAQANLDGGGNTDADRRARTPLPVLPKDSAREDIALATERVQTLEKQTQELITQLRNAPSLPVQPRPTDQAQPTESPTANEMMQRTMDAMRLEAQIAKDLDAYAKRPKRHFVGSRAEEYRYARYVEDWRLKVERIGNLNYPEAARKQKLYGSLVITVSIRADGSVEDVIVNKTSGKRVLDAAAVHIVRLAAPYAAFPPDVRRDTDILHITRTWTFAKGDELVTNAAP
jgi:protein TonB